MDAIANIARLEEIYDAAAPNSLVKVAKRMTPHYRQWIETSRFAILSSVGPEGTDASPRGEDGPVARIADDTTLHMPDWRGNNRLDTLRNIVRDPRVSLLFMVPGCENVVRINGQAVLTADEALCQSFAKNGKVPRTVIVVTLEEMYFQCAKAIMRSHLWSGEDESDRLPTAGDFIKEMKADFDGATYDATYPVYAKDKMW